MKIEMKNSSIYMGVIFSLIFAFALSGCDTGNTPEEGRGKLLNPEYTTSESDGDDDGEEAPGSLYEAVLREVDKIIAATKISVNGGETDQASGKPVYVGFYWVDSATLAALEDAVKEVQEETVYLLNAGVSPTLLDPYAAIIQQALDAFIAARMEGVQPLDWTSLETAWDAAKAEFDGIDLDEYPSGSAGVLATLGYDAAAVFKSDATLAAYEAFEAVLTEIKEWLDAGKEAAPGTVTQDDIDLKIAEVQEMPGIFSASLSRGYWVTVPAGKFQRDDTSTNISVITQAYNMGAFEVTQELWFEVMGRNNSFNKTDGNLQLPVDGGADAATSASNMGLTHVYTFCNKLSEMMGKTPVYSRTGGTAINTGTYTSDAWWSDIVMDDSANGYRLPTEMEWMWAAMGADSTEADMQDGVNVKGYKKDFAGDSDPDTSGDSPLDYAWTATYDAAASYPAVTGNTGGSAGNNTPSYSKPVGGKLPNELGIYDMSGNLTEYCWDATGDNLGWTAGTLTDYKNSDMSQGRRVVIGGDYGGNYPVVISRARWEATKNGSNNWAHRYYGFRIVCKAETAE